MAKEEGNYRKGREKVRQVKREIKVRQDINLGKRSI